MFKFKSSKIVDALKFLIVGKSFELQDGSSGIVSKELVDDIKNANVDLICNEHVAPTAYWMLQAQEYELPVIEAKIAAAKEKAANSEANRHLLPELEFALRVVLFEADLFKKKEQSQDNDFADIFAAWFHSLIPDTEARSIYRPWNKGGVKGFAFTNKSFAPLEWQEERAEEEEDAGGSSSIAIQGDLMIRTRLF